MSDRATGEFSPSSTFNLCYLMRIPKGHTFHFNRLISGDSEPNEGKCVWVFVSGLLGDLGVDVLDRGPEGFL